MLKSYFKIAWRNLLKDRQFTFLNVVGLATSEGRTQEDRRCGKRLSFSIPP